MAEVQKIGNVTFRMLTNEEALQKYGSSFVFIGSRSAKGEGDGVAGSAEPHFAVGWNWRFKGAPAALPT